ncbi:trypsin-like peptidase domain-containing protein [Georgenia alba]|uniref:Trypsin-like peptidase domain-containing protein n=1 Tax=Georgenia alba TaxID=2233858 RepID=A0ABW2QE30_9MICO
MSSHTPDPAGHPAHDQQHGPSAEPYPASWSTSAAPPAWQTDRPEAVHDPYGGAFASPYSGPYGARAHGHEHQGRHTYGSGAPPEPAGPDASAATFAPVGAGPRRERRGPGWGAVVAIAAGVAVVASVGTVGLTSALDTDGSGSPQTQVTAPSDGPSGEPVVTSTTDDPDWANVAAAVRPSVVAIQVQAPGGSGLGSGVVLDEDGNILTNNHVVSAAQNGGQIVVTLSDGRQYPAEVAGTDAATDLAVLTLQDPPDDLTPATIGSSDDVVVGDQVMAVGNPIGLSDTVTTGIVSALDRPVATASAEQQMPGQQVESVVTNAIQVDAAINPGNSGGPLFDATGRVIGITSSNAGVPGSEDGGSIGLGFAIPSDLASRVGEQLVSDGVAKHAYLGVYATDGAAQVDGAQRTGAQIEQIEPGTPAADAGLEPGDVVIGIGEDAVNGAQSLTGYVRQYASGDQVTLTVVRDGEEEQITATLATREDQV